jgi:hypothetical protein
LCGLHAQKSVIFGTSTFHLFSDNMSIYVTNHTGDYITLTHILKQAVSQNVKMINCVAKSFSEDTGIKGI